MQFFFRDDLLRRAFRDAASIQDNDPTSPQRRPSNYPQSTPIATKYGPFYLNPLNHHYKKDLQTPCIRGTLGGSSLRNLPQDC